MNRDIAEQASLKPYTPLSVFGPSKREMQDPGPWIQGSRVLTQSKLTPLLGRTLICDLSLRGAEQSGMNVALYFLTFFLVVELTGQAMRPVTKNIEQAGITGHNRHCKGKLLMNVSISFDNLTQSYFTVLYTTKILTVTKMQCATNLSSSHGAAKEQMVKKKKKIAAKRKLLIKIKRYIYYGAPC